MIHVPPSLMKLDHRVFMLATLNPWPLPILYKSPTKLEIKFGISKQYFSEYVATVMHNVVSQLHR